MRTCPAVLHYATPPNKWPNYGCQGYNRWAKLKQCCQYFFIDNQFAFKINGPSHKTGLCFALQVLAGTSKPITSMGPFQCCGRLALQSKDLVCSPDMDHPVMGHGLIRLLVCWLMQVDTPNMPVRYAICPSEETK